MPSVSEEDSSGQLKRIAYVSLPSLASRSGNIDVSCQGTVALQTEETIYIFTPAIGTSKLLISDVGLTCHHDPSQKVPFFRSSIPIKSCPLDISKAGSGLEAYMIMYEPRFIDTKWSPDDIGSFKSPILAVLTTQSQIFLFTADTNQFKGPWRQLECLTGGDERHIVSMAWVDENLTQSLLIGGTRQGEVIVWRVRANEVKELSVTSLGDGDIIGIVSSPAGNLFLSTTKGNFVAKVSRLDSGSVTFGPATYQPPSLSGSQISLAKWEQNVVLYCTPGQLHSFDADTGICQSVFLESSEDDESCSFRPAVAIDALRSNSWNVYLNDGTLYQIPPETLKREFLRPTSYLYPPIEVIGSLQRKVEAARGLFAKCDDGAGLSYICHDDNEIASWSYYREPKCQFSLALNPQLRTTQELPMANQLLEAVLNGDSRHLRTFITFYKYLASSKTKIWTMLIQALQREIESKQIRQAALRLSVWMQSEDSREEVSIMTIHKSILESSLAQALQHRINSTLSKTRSSIQADDAQHCTRLAKAGYTLSVRLKYSSLKNSSEKLMKSVDKGVNLTMLSSKDSFDLGETCKACGSSIDFQTDNMLYAKCQKGHIWKRCATSLALLTTSTNRICSICSSETIQPMHATSMLQKHLIESLSSCDLCNGTFFL